MGNYYTQKVICQMDPEDGTMWYFTNSGDWSDDIYMARRYEANDIKHIYRNSNIWAVESFLKFPNQTIQAREVIFQLTNHWKSMADELKSE